jgi:hypothetical protein
MLSSASARSADRIERRAGEMALPDAYLDPSWPDEGSARPIVPEESDSVENAPLAEEKPDAAEAEEAERYKEVLGQQDDSGEMRQSQIGGTPERPEPDDEETRDPAQW